MDALVVALEIVVPDRAALGEPEDRRLVGHARPGRIARHHEAEGDSAVVRARFERVANRGLRALRQRRNPQPVAAVTRGRVDSVPWKGLVHAVALDTSELDAPAELDAVHDDAERRGRDDGLTLEGHLVRESRFGAEDEAQFDRALRAHNA